MSEVVGLVVLVAGFVPERNKIVDARAKVAAFNASMSELASRVPVGTKVGNVRILSYGDEPENSTGFDALPEYIPPSPEDQRRWEATEKTAQSSVGVVFFTWGILALLAGSGAWLAATLIVFVLAFLWWFFMDRIREISRAARS